MTSSGDALPGDPFRCSVCGYRLDTPPWGIDGKNPTFDFCPCCGVQFGYQDCLQAAVEKQRARWLAGGARWSEPSEMPADWNLEEQLRYVNRGSDPSDA